MEDRLIELLEGINDKMDTIISKLQSIETESQRISRDVYDVDKIRDSVEEIAKKLK